MKTYSELILGLPGETYKSFTEGVGKLFEIGQHFVFEAYNCILLPNSVMGQKEYIKKHGIKTVHVEIVRPHFNNDSFSVPEYNRIIIETNTMSREMWVRSSAFIYMVKALHGNGFIRAFAIYTHYVKGIPYEEFYDGILNYFEENPELFISKLYFDVKHKADELSLGHENKRFLFEPTGEVVWEDHEYVVLNSLANFDRFYDEVIPYLKRYGIEEDIFEDLLSYQKAIMRKPCEETVKISLKYDIHRYITDIYVNKVHNLEERRNTLVLRDSKVHDNWPDFAKYVIWYERVGWSSYKDDISEE